VGGIADTIPSANALGETIADTGEQAPRRQPVRGEQIARFVVLDVLGEGGMGVVYAAYDPNLDRKVAIKLLAASMHSEEARLRLLREAQAMARIDHPNVLRVHEAGTFGDQVYIAMEFAAGGTLRDWLGGGNRTIDEIITLYAAAGRGLAAAHAAGLVHRDFKPDNVLLTDAGPRVTDFGLVGVVGEMPPARPADLDKKLSDTTPLSEDLTRTGALMGTPGYMAPEQFRGGLVGPAADQFAFCVALYDALYRSRPFAGSTYAELCANVISGELQPVPRDSVVPTRIRRVLVRGLANDPKRRYPTMDALLEELLPRRVRRAGMIAAVAGGLAVVAVGVLVLRQHDQAPAPCGGADERLAVAWSPAQRAKIDQAFQAGGRPDAKAVFDHLVPIVDRWGDSWKQGYVAACEDTRVRRVQSEQLLDLRMQCLTRRLDEARATIDLLAAGGGDAIDHGLDAARALPAVAPCADTAALTSAKALPTTPEAQQQIAAIRADLDHARAQRKLGRYAPGLAEARKALDAARKAQLPPLVADALLAVGTLQSDLADKTAEDTLGEAMTTAMQVGDGEVATRAAAARITAMGQNPAKFPIAAEIGKLADAIAAHQPPSAEARVELDNAGALALARQGKRDEAQTRYEHALALATSQLGPDAPATLTTLRRMGTLAAARHKYDDELKLFQQVLAAQERVTGSEHPDVATALENVANAYGEQQKIGDSKQLRERAIAIRLAALGPDHPDVGSSYNNMGGFYESIGDHVTAKSYYEKAIENFRKAYGDDSVELTDPMDNLADVLNEMGDHKAAREMLERSRSLFEKAYSPEDPRLAPTLAKLGVVARDERRFDDALGLFQRAEALVTKGFGAKDPEAVDYLGETATTYTLMNKLPEARETMSSTLSAITTVYGPDHLRMAVGLGNYGFLQIKLKDYKGALASFDKTQEIVETKVGKTHPNIAAALIGASQALISLKREPEAVPRLERALEIGTAAHMAPSQVAEIHYYLAVALFANPATRARARAEAATAIKLFEQAHDAVDVAATKKWLKKH
jgi:tetratricopeptide (TPR) repeat protein